jgi:arylsulfatase A-like enzyme
VQTDYLILILNLILVFGLTISIFWLLKREQNKEKSHFKIYSLSIISIIFVITFIFIINKKIIIIHPISSIFINSTYNENPFDYEIIDTVLLKKDKTPELPEKFTDSPVIIIMIESMRYDLINIDPCPIPFIKSLIEQSYLFSKSYAVSSHSDYADLSLWYSNYPLRSSKRTKYKKNSLFRRISIFQVFKDLNYETAYISSQNEKWGSMINWLDVPEIDFFYHSENYNKVTWYNKDDKDGLASLIKNKIARAGKIEDSETVNIAKEWISQLKEKRAFFLGMNLQNTHFNYIIPPGGVEPFQPATIDFPAVFYRWPEEKLQFVYNRYLNAIYNVDIILKNFAYFLKELEVWDRCYFIIIGDSGEAFYEHGFGNHAGPMYDEVVRTFTLIKPPKNMATKIIENPISHVDILPGVLDLMNIPIPNSFQGLSPFKTDLKRLIYLHSNAIVQQDGIIDWPWKLLVNYQPAKEAELYNLEIDPLERRNLINSYEDKAVLLLDKLTKWRNTQIAYYTNPQYYLNFEPPRLN